MVSCRAAASCRWKPALRCAIHRNSTPPSETLQEKWKKEIRRCELAVASRPKAMGSKDDPSPWPALFC
eukprot:CAMPEP_0183431684 /NCGR_PEP_ID=MMETSP0370-20130417/54982_1 /TAXON_ID=268820 /ORGANISM="Peridinium aciculiferum, Strain PAER-2" /LENGTH=67 /DNA_ID=CAMNT_0025617435 /DNA_START=64 /DNA_END=264 /DNA_ORIENTATION=-